MWIINQLLDSSFSSSSEWNRNHSAKFCRFNSTPKIANWSAKENKSGEWLQVDLNGYFLINAVRLQGRNNNPQWVTKYELWISNDQKEWVKFEDLPGTSGQDTFSEFRLPSNVFGRYVRFIAIEWVGHISMRIDIDIEDSKYNAHIENFRVDENKKSSFSMKMTLGTKVQKENVDNYISKWYHESFKYNEKTEISCIASNEILALLDPNIFFDLGPKNLFKINQNILNNKTIPVLTFLENIFETQQKKNIWWVIPFCIWREDVVSLVYADKNGIYGMYEDCLPEPTLLVPWENLTNLEFITSFENDKNINRIFLHFDQDFLSLDELVDPDKGNGSYLSVLHAIYQIRKTTIELSKGQPVWYEGAGGEGFQIFNSGLELIEDSNWVDPFRPNPEDFGYKSKVMLTDSEMGLKEKIFSDSINIVAFILVCVAGVNGDIDNKENLTIIEKLSEWTDNDISENLHVAKEFWQTLQNEEEKEVLTEAAIWVRNNMPNATRKALAMDLYSIINADGSEDIYENGIFMYIHSILQIE
jgi:hypothetical protein